MTAAKKLSDPALTKEKFLSEEERELLIKHLNRYKKDHPRDTTLIFTAMFTGARASEVLNIRKQDLTKPNLVMIYGLKGSRDRQIPVPDWLFKSLMKLPSNPVSGKIFDITYPRLNQIWRTWRTVNKKFHSLRHTFAVRQFTRTKDQRLIQTALGHRSPLNTNIYLDFVYSSEQMQKLIED